MVINYLSHTQWCISFLVNASFTQIWIVNTIKNVHNMRWKILIGTGYINIQCMMKLPNLTPPPPLYESMAAMHAGKFDLNWRVLKKKKENTNVAIWWGWWKNILFTNKTTLYGWTWLAFHTYSDHACRWKNSSIQSGKFLLWQTIFQLGVYKTLWTRVMSY
jgi:hypothetical protein